MIRLFENDDVILDKDEKTNEYRLSFFKNGHYKSEERYPFYNFIPWVNRLPECDIFGIDWKDSQNYGRVKFVMPYKGEHIILHTEGMRPTFVKEFLNQLVDDSIIEE